VSFFFIAAKELSFNSRGLLVGALHAKRCMFGKFLVHAQR
jgi:hypothetical protein